MLALCPSLQWILLIKGSWYYVKDPIPKLPMEKVWGGCTVRKRRGGEDTLGVIGAGKQRLVHRPHLIILKM